MDEVADRPDGGNSPQPSFAELLDWVEGRLTRDAAQAMALRVEASNPATRRTVEWIREFMALARSNPLPAPPPLVRQRLQQTFAKHHLINQPICRLTAELSLDSRDDTVLAGVRGGAEVDETYRLAFAVGSTGILIDIVPEEDGRFFLDGQVLSNEPGPVVWQVSVHHPRGTVTDVGGDEHGSFSVRGVPRDVIELVLSNGVTEIGIERPLGHSR